MRIAIISDIHSNVFALSAVVDEFKNKKIDKVLNIGDIFGYYPWAVETYKIIKELDLITIKGNHDLIVTQKVRPQNAPSYWELAQDNRKELLKESEEILTWLEGLDGKLSLNIEQHSISLYHGTPDDIYEGRYYPDDDKTYSWFPKKDEIIILGQTHYPMEKRFKNGGIIINPGSIGQPRDGNPFPSWCILDTKQLFIDWIRTRYDYKSAMTELKRINWDKRTAAALGKIHKGKLKFE
jgi:putative phosphoesterase